MPSNQPFQQLFETFGRPPESHSESVNRSPREALKGWLDSPIGEPGHCMLLKAPRAGYGKTHLLTILLHEMGGSHEFVPLRAVGGSRIDSSTVLDDILRRLVRVLPAAGGLTVLDLVARRLFAAGLQPLVNSGEVPCQDREAALVALSDRPIETFDFHHPNAVTARWAKDNFELLGPRLALELSRRNGLSLREVSFWVDVMFLFSSARIDNPERVRTLAAQVFDNAITEATADERLIALLGLLTTLLRMVLVADELEGFSLDDGAALRFASFICALRQSVERLDVIVSVNQDIWESAFLPRLSAGLTDRLSELAVELEPLDHGGVVAIIESRFPGEGESFAPKIIATHARGVLAEAARTRSSKDNTEAADPARADQIASFPVAPEAPATASPAPTDRQPGEVEDAACETPPQPVTAPEPEIPLPPGTGTGAVEWPAPDLNAPKALADIEDFVPATPLPPAAASVSLAFDDQSPFRSKTIQNSPIHGRVEQLPGAETGSQPLQDLPSPAPHPPAGEPAPAAAANPAAEKPSDRVDELLRQFRERYGKL